MRKLIACTAILGLFQCTSAFADALLNEAFASLYDMLGDTNMSKSAFLDGVSSGFSGWTNRYSLSRARINDQSLRDWYCTMSMASVTNVVEYSEMDSWLQAKAIAIRSIGVDAAVRGDTNCWFAVAREHGRLRSGLHTDAELDAMRGAVSRQVDTNGIVTVFVPDISSDDIRRRHVLVNDLAQREELYSDFLSDVGCVFVAFASSDTFRNLSPSGRNAIISNLVETARFTPDEASALGLTNVVEVVPAK